jgi:dephospho-CoA kinase
VTLNSTQEDPAPAINHAFAVALTGGIASGKTLISDEFARLGVPVIDTDVIARTIVEPGMPALLEIEQTMGSQFIDRKGRLDRSRLRVTIFSDPEARQNLESILHPRIQQAVSEAIKEVTSAYCIVVIPLLAEKGTYPNVNRVLVVDVEPETQIARLMARDNCSRREAKQALAAQANRKQRLKIADDILDNSGTPGQAREKVAQLNQRYLQLAKSRVRNSLRTV